MGGERKDSLESGPGNKREKLRENILQEPLSWPTMGDMLP